MKAKILILLFFVLLGLYGCTKTINSLTIIGDTSIEVNESKYLEVEANVNLDFEVVYSSSDLNVLEVDEEGKVTGVGVGTATVTATLKDNEKISASIEITVKDAEIQNLIIDGPKEIFVNSTAELKIFSNPSHANKNVTWKSSDESIATVSETGVVTGVSTGFVDITATSVIDSTKTAVQRIQVSLATSTEFEIQGPMVVGLGEEVEYTAMSDGVDMTLNFKWEVSDSEVATITSTGRLKPIKVGSVIVKAISNYNSSIYKEINVEIVEFENIYQKTKILAIDRSQNYIEFLNIPATTLDSSTKYVKYNGTDVVNASLTDLYVGMENIYVEYKENSNVINKILIDKEPGFKNIRVGIRQNINDISIDATRFHNSIDLRLYSKAKIQTFDNSESVNVNALTNLFITISNNKMVIKDDSKTLLETNKRVIIVPENAYDAIEIRSITRGSNRRYSGNLEVGLFINGMIVVNDIDLEMYLYKVVPSEMPASYHSEALKAQAIAARTYAYRDIFNRGYERNGYTVDDSVQSQVYNNQNAQTNTTNAINATKGLVMMNNGDLVNAFYYSTSSGLTASAHEVWITDSYPNVQVIPYLIGQNLATHKNGEKFEFDYTDEASMLNFFKTLDVVTPDNNIAFHRWKTTFTKQQLTTTISKNLTLRYAQNPKLILTKDGDKFVSKPISTNIGEVESVYVGKRGESGVVMELIVQTTTNTYKIINQYNMRFTIRPMDAGVSNYTATATSKSYSKSGSNSILFSGFFAIEEVNGTITFYGGGNGHGVGMSQNGANSLGKSGYTFKQILNTYYSNIDLIDITYDYIELPNFKDYFFK